MKRQRIACLGVSLAVLFAAVLIFADPASGGVSFRLSVGGRSGSRGGHSSYRSPYSGSRYRGNSYSGRSYGGSYRSRSYYRSPILNRSYTTTYYTTSPYTSYYGSSSSGSYRSSSRCGSCGSSCRCASESSSYYSRPTTTYQTYSSRGYGSSGTVVRYIIVH
jgi:hypothetical protein